MLKSQQNPLPDYRERDLVNIEQQRSVPEAANTMKIRHAAEGSWSFLMLQKTH